MGTLYNPANDVDVLQWMTKIGLANGTADNWKRYAGTLISTMGCSKMSVLRKMRSKDVDDARQEANLSIGYYHTLCVYLANEASDPFEFTAQPTAAAGPKLRDGIQRKKFASQRDRPTLGYELGAEGLARLALPKSLDRIKWGPDRPMKSKGKYSTEHVADLIYAWVVAKFGNTHVDTNFCETLEDLLLQRWPLLDPWGKFGAHPRPRRWAAIIKNRFPNVRESKARLCTPKPTHPSLHTLA